MVILPEFFMRQYRDGGHLEYAPLFTHWFKQKNILIDYSLRAPRYEYVICVYLKEWYFSAMYYYL